MRADELDYVLPKERIAQRPLDERDAARLLCVGRTGALLDRGVRELPGLLPSKALLVFNDTRVMPARLRGHKPSGGKVELLLVRPLQPQALTSQRWLALGKASKSLQPGATIDFEQGLCAKVLRRHADGSLEVNLEAAASVAQAIAAQGELPLPPYIARAPGAQDQERYQTVFARTPGAVAAPTAGLHFTEALLQALRDAGHSLAYVTLHVGPGTFAPLRTEQLSEHSMHAERYEIPEQTAAAIAEAKGQGRPVVAVGTTVVRSLEAAAQQGGGLGPGTFETSIFIYPPYRFRVVDVLMTNFHLPRSTLLALVMAFGGVDQVRAAYDHAVRNEYRFYSYGDAMLLGVTP